MSETVVEGTAGGLRCRSPRSGAQGRLLDAIIHVAGRDGYAELTVERVLEAAAVSRASFYQYFSSLDDCFQDAYRQRAEALVRRVAGAIRGGESAERALLSVFVDLAIRDPDGARALMIEGLAAGPLGLERRDALVAELGRLMKRASGNRPAVDIPAELLIGGALRFLSIRLTSGEVTKMVGAEIWEWAQTFLCRHPQPRWSARFAPCISHGNSSHARVPQLRLSHGSPRERLLRATAETIMVRGYRDATVAQIVTAAGVSRRRFYDEFANKSDAFIAAYEHTFERVLEACTPAFFSSREWPQRVWHSAHAFTTFFAREPALAHLGFVDCYAVGRGFVRRVHDTQLAFTVFLEEGYRQRDEARILPRACSELTTATMMELGFQASRHTTSQHIRRLQPLAVYIVLTPFIGPDVAAKFVLENLG